MWIAHGPTLRASERARGWETFARGDTLNGITQHKTRCEKRIIADAAARTHPS